MVEEMPPIKKTDNAASMAGMLVLRKRLWVDDIVSFSGVRLDIARPANGRLCEFCRSGVVSDWLRTVPADFTCLMGRLGVTWSPSAG